jgi:hypothetical protein
MRVIVLWTMKIEAGARTFGDNLSICKNSMKLFMMALALILITSTRGEAEPDLNQIYGKFVVNSDGIWFRKCWSAASKEKSNGDDCEKLGQVHKGNTVYVGYQVEDKDSESGKWSGIYLDHLQKKETDIDKYRGKFSEEENKAWVYVKSEFLTPFEGEVENYWERYNLKSETNREAFISFLSIFPNADRTKIAFAYSLGCSSNGANFDDFERLVCETTKSLLYESSKSRLPKLPKSKPAIVADDRTDNSAVATNEAVMLNEVQGLRADIISNEQIRISLEGEIESLEADLKTLRSKYRSEIVKNRDARKEVSIISNAMEKIKNANTRADEEVSKLKTRVSKLQAERDALKNKLTYLQNSKNDDSAIRDPDKNGSQKEPPAPAKTVPPTPAKTVSPAPKTKSSQRPIPTKVENPIEVQAKIERTDWDFVLKLIIGSIVSITGVLGLGFAGHAVYQRHRGMIDELEKSRNTIAKLEKDVANERSAAERQRMDDREAKERFSASSNKARVYERPVNTAPVVPLVSKEDVLQEYAEALFDSGKMSAFKTARNVIGLERASRANTDENIVLIPDNGQTIDRSEYWAVPSTEGSIWWVFPGRKQMTTAATLVADDGRAGQREFKGIFNITSGKRFECQSPAEASKTSPSGGIIISKLGVVQLPSASSR